MSSLSSSSPTETSSVLRPKSVTVSAAITSTSGVEATGKHSRLNRSWQPGRSHLIDYMIPDEDKQRAVRLSEVRELRDPPSELKEVCDKISPIISDIYLARGVVARGVGKDLETLRSECDSKIEEATRLVTREETRRKEYGSDTTDTLPDAGSDTASGSGLSSLDPKGKRKAELQIPQTVSSEARKPIPE
ncbi:MAG: hypothetical protein TREMPRED_005771 [Tremellales sp. Tagirdzhanova-0007]|nr:MAG: hypothetical protein TREMPRED_005771 [Tremellales sp. Tagirdzhanova-0007]